jgi:hypothetical protein
MLCLSKEEIKKRLEEKCEKCLAVMEYSDGKFCPIEYLLDSAFFSLKRTGYYFNCSSGVLVHGFASYSTLGMYHLSIVVEGVRFVFSADNLEKLKEKVSFLMEKKTFVVETLVEASTEKEALEKAKRGETKFNVREV